MKDWLPTFLSELHRTELKGLGFRKVRNTFSRDAGLYWERFNFQGSTRNYTGVEYWRFYLNVGVEFKDFEPERYWSGFAHTHWTGRIRRVAPDAPHQWEYNQHTGKEALSRELVLHITNASRRVAETIDDIRGQYLRTKVEK